jgi:transcriptional regulator with XRE-family HTH domain
MQDRLNKLITSEKLSPSKFAEIIGVQRSSISHMLSGRNKPSFDVIQLIIKKFPRISVDWLMMGTGDMYRKPVQTNLFDQTPQSPSLPSMVSSSPLPEYTNKEVKVNNAPDPVNVVPISKVPENALNEKQVDRVLIFYSDKTFTEYKPG